MTTEDPANKLLPASAGSGRPRVRVIGYLIALVSVGTLVGSLSAKDRLQAVQAASVQSLPAPTAYRATPENDAKLRRFVSSVLTFSLLHEAGHLIISEYQVPVLGREEDAADRFAVAALASPGTVGVAMSDAKGNPLPHPLLAAALFWETLHARSEANHEELAWADEHGLPRQRAHMIACLLYGSNPGQFEKLAQQVGIDADRRRSCIKEAAQNQRSWSSVIAPHLASRDDQIAVIVANGTANAFYHPVGERGSKALRDALLRAKHTVEDMKVLEGVAEVIRGLKPPPDFGPQRASLDQLTQKMLENLASKPLTPAEIERKYRFRATADSCLTKDGKAMVNAFWNRDERTIILCYGFVAEVENIGKSLIASRDR